MPEQSLISVHTPAAGTSPAAADVLGNVNAVTELNHVELLPVNALSPDSADGNEGHPANPINVRHMQGVFQPESLLQRKYDASDGEETLTDEEEPVEDVVQRKEITSADSAEGQVTASQNVAQAVPFAATIAPVVSDGSVSSNATTTSAAYAETAPPELELQEENDELRRQPFIQRKITIGAPDDPLEREADNMADQVMRMPEQTVQRKPFGTQISSQNTPIHDIVPARGAISFIQTKAGTGSPSVPEGVASGITEAAGKGAGMDMPTRSFMENRFGADFSGVGIHAGSHAAQMSTAINAQAFTVGKDIYFNEGRYAPETSSGKHLLAHELTHVVQQNDDVYAKRDRPGAISHQGEAIVQRFGNDDVEIPIETDLQNGLVFQQWKNHGQGLLTYRGTRWMIFQWTGGLSDRSITVTMRINPATSTIDLTFSAPFPVTARISQDADEFIAGGNGGNMNFNYHFQFTGNVKSYRNGREVESIHPPAHISRRISVPQRTITEGEMAWMGVGEMSRPILSAMPPVHDYSRVWQLNTQQEFNRFAAAHPDTNWACIVTPDGKFIAYALTRDTLHRFADNIRRGDYRRQFGDEFNGRLSTVFIHGHQLSSLEELRDLYYTDASEAAVGMYSQRSLSGDINFECAIYDMGDGSYGRKALTHEQALDMWRALANMPVGDVFNYEVEPGHKFVELNVFGRGRLIRSLNRRYFQGRDLYYSFITLARSRGQEPLVSDSTDEMYYMEVEAARPDINVTFQASLVQNPTLAGNLQDVVYGEVEHAGQEEAIRLLRQSQERLSELATNPGTLASFIIGFHTLSQTDKVDGLAMLGLVRQQPGFMLFAVINAENQIYDYIFETLSDVNRARRVLLGLDTPVYNALRSHAAETAQGIQNIITSLENMTVIAIRAEGDFGIQVRNLAYQRMGFTRLQGNTFPHTNEVGDSFPGPMSGNTASFGSIAEQLYANRIVSMTNEQRVMHFVGITAAILLAAVLIIASAGAGAAVAGAFFAEGTAAFIATDMIVGGITYTALNEGASQLMGGGDFRRDDVRGSVERLGVTAVGNILTFGVFRGLNAMFGALGRAAVGGEQIAAGSARAVTAEGIRIGGLFSTTYMSSIIQARIRTGRYPDKGELAIMFYENALTLLTLEVGGRMAQPLMEDVGIWARGRRLGPEFNQRINTMMEDVAGLQRQTAAFIERPSDRSIEIVARQQQLLEQQRDLVNALRAHNRLSRTGDAEMIEKLAGEELQRIGETLTLIQDVRFIAESQMRPSGDDNLNFYYRPGTEARIREHYGADNVQGPDRSGAIRVRQGEQTLTFRPEPAETAPTQPVTNTGRGGVRGQVYELGGSLSLASRARSRRLSVSEIFNYLTEAPPTQGGPRNTILRSLATRLFGSTLSWTTGMPYYDFSVPVPGRATPVTVRVTIKVQGYDTNGLARNESVTGPHGDDTGSATYSMSYEQTSAGGLLRATINVSPNIRVNPESMSTSRDLETVVGHELDEIADITRIFLRNSSPTQELLDAVLAREAQAVVARPGSRARAASLTSHDRATVEQLFRHFTELNDPAIPNADARFTRMLESMGLTGRSTSAQFVEFMSFLELAMNTSELPGRTTENVANFRNRVEIQWRLLVSQRVLSTAAAANLLPGGQRIVTAELIDHILFPRDTGGNFSGSGISGGHATSYLEAVNADPTSPLYVVREATIALRPGGAAHRYHQYRLKGNVSGKAAAPRPTQVPGGAEVIPTPGTHYDPAFWETPMWNNPNAPGGPRGEGLPKSAVDDLNAFLPEAELAFADYFRSVLQPNATLYGNGRLFRHTYNGVTFMGYYNYNGGTLTGGKPDVSLNSIFVDAQTIR